MKQFFVFLMALLLSISALAEKPVKPDKLQAITNSQLASGDIFLLYDLSAGYTKKMTVSELDTRWAGGGGGGGITSLNALTGATQTFATGTSGTNFSISSSGTTHTFSIPSASGSARGLLSSSDWTAFNAKAPTASPTFSGTVTLSDGTASRVLTLNADKQVTGVITASLFTGHLEQWGGQIETAADKTYVLIPSAPVAMQVVSLRAWCASGSITGKLQIANADGSSATDITTCTGVSIGTTAATTTCSTGSSNDLSAGKRLLFVTSSNSSCLDLIPSVITSRD